MCFFSTKKFNDLQKLISLALITVYHFAYSENFIVLSEKFIFMRINYYQFDNMTAEQREHLRFWTHYSNNSHSGNDLQIPLSDLIHTWFIFNRQLRFIWISVIHALNTNRHSKDKAQLGRCYSNTITKLNQFLGVDFNAEPISCVNHGSAAINTATAGSFFIENQIVPVNWSVSHLWHIRTRFPWIVENE